VVLCRPVLFLNALLMPLDLLTDLTDGVMIVDLLTDLTDGVRTVDLLLLIAVVFFRFEEFNVTRVDFMWSVMLYYDQPLLFFHRMRCRVTDRQVLMQYVCSTTL
jgi:hypothetical protein